nr:exodeoxyribonuclease VII large subunit [Novosphingobium sp. 9U]
MFMALPFDDDDYGDERKAPLVAKAMPGDNAEPLSISELSARLKRTVEDRFGFVRLRGELSGVKRAASGHLYCCLKDDKAVIDGVMWKGGAQRLAFRPEDGVEVIATGKLTTYPGRSKYQIVVESMEIAGEGALLALLEKLRTRLAAEGLFSEANKKPLPFLPATIGVVTSPTGAVIRDILHRLADRFPSRVLVWPVLVQGDGAASQVAAAVRGFSAMPADGAVPRPDLVIVARGGGSIEDLWSFNEEIVVRAVAECTIPTISAVGHETDTTLCDYAADRRAPTPTAAAEMAVPVRAELGSQLAELALRKRRCALRPVALGRERLEARARHLPRPEALLAVKAQRLDEASERLRRALRERAAGAGARLDAQGARLSLPLLRHRVERAEERLARAGLTPALLQRQFDIACKHFAPVARVLPQLNPDKPLARGFARVIDASGHTLTDKTQAEREPTLTLRFRDGDLTVVPNATPRRAARPKEPGVQQGDLF